MGNLSSSENSSNNKIIMGMALIKIAIIIIMGLAKLLGIYSLLLGTELLRKMLINLMVTILPFLMARPLKF